MKTVQSIAFVGSVPEKYDRYLGPVLFEPYALDIISRISVGSVQSVLEIACGTGRVTRHLRKLLPADIRLVGSDLNPDMLEVAKKVVNEKNIDWQVADAQDLPFENDVFDLVVCQFGIMFMHDKLKALSEVHRVLRKDGKFILNTWDRIENNSINNTANREIVSFFKDDPPVFYQVPFSMFDESELRSLIANAGFRDIQIERIEKQGLSPSAAELAIGLTEGTPIYGEILAKGRQHLTVLQEKIEDAVSAAHGDRPVKGLLHAWVCEAKK